VEDIGLDETNNKVRVTMKLKKTAIVRTDSTATVKFTGLMGQNFVAIDFGKQGSPALRDGDFVTTGEEPDFSAIMTKLDNVAAGAENLFKSFTGDQIDNVLGPLTHILREGQIPLTQSVSNLQEITTQIREGKGTIGKLINDDTLYNSTLASVKILQDTAADIKLTLADTRKVVDQANTAFAQINSGQGTVGKLLKDDKLYNESTASMTNLKEILEKINQGQGSVGKLVTDQEFYRNAKLTLQKLDKATEGLEDQGPLSVMGVLVNKLF